MSSTIGDKIRSGVPALDQRWDGLYRGGAYLVYGRVSSGRGHVGLRVVSAGVEDGERALLVSEERLANLIIQARECGLDLEAAFRSGHASLLRPHEIGSNGASRVEGKLGGLASAILDRRPDRVVLSDLLSIFAGSDEAAFLRGARRLLDAASALSAVIVMLVPEPTFSTSRRLIELLLSLSTASIHVQPRPDEIGLELLPRIGHVTRGGPAAWRIDGGPHRTRLETVLKAGTLDDAGAQSRDTPPDTLVASRPEQPATAVESLTGNPSQFEEAQAAGPPKSIDVDQLFEEVLDEIIAEGGAHIEQQAAREANPAVEGAEERLENLEDVGGLDSGRTDQTETSNAAEPEQGSDTHVSDVLQGGAGRNESGLEALETAPPHMLDDRDVFENHLKTAFQAEGADKDFVLVGMRLDDQNDPEPLQSLTILATVAAESLRSNDVLFADRRQSKLVALLRDARSHDATAFFERVKRGIRVHTGNGDRMLDAVSAVIADRGRPFNDPGSFLSYVLDSD